MENLKDHGKYFIFYAFYALALHLATLIYAFLDPMMILKWWLANPGILFFNWLPIFLALVIIHCLSRHVQVPIVLVSVAVLGLAAANHMKILHRQEPVFFDDLVLVKEAISIVFQGNYDLGRVLLPLLGLVAIVLLIHLIPFIKDRYQLEFKPRAITLALGLALGMVLLNTAYSEAGPLDPLLPTRAEEEINISQTVQDQGLVYSFFRYRGVNRAEKPHPFRQSEVQEKIDLFDYQDMETKPDVIFIMGEAWTDMSNLETLNFYEGQDPMAPLRGVYEESLASGHVLVPSFGGGTANTEFDGVTGMSTLLMSSGRFTAYSAIRRPIPSLATALGDQGYNTYAFHPGKDWFYNRDQVYGFMGYEKKEFEDDLVGAEYKGDFVSETATYNHLMARLDDLREDPLPYLALCVTIQNHGPFQADKYGYVEETFTSEVSLSPEFKEALEVYFMGIRDMNDEILRLVEALREEERPTLLVYWGDHLPSLGQPLEAYNHLGYPYSEDPGEGELDIYKTPYFIWANPSFKEALPQERAYPDLISASYLTPIALDICGGRGLDPFYDMSLDMLETMPAIHLNLYQDASVEVPTFRPQEDMSLDQAHMLEIYLTWSYLRMAKGTEF